MKKNSKKPGWLGLVLTALLISLTLTLPVLANSAVSYGEGEVTVENVAGNVTAFKAFRVFKGTKNTDGSMSNFVWESDAVKTAVTGVLKAADSAYSSQNAQEAADYISDLYRVNTDVWNSSMKIADDEILEVSETLNKIAKKVSEVSTGTAVEAGTATTLGEGYWVIVTDSNYINDGEDGTSPIFVVLGADEEITINEKTTVPTSKLNIMDDSKGTVYSENESLWGISADAERNQSVVLKVTGTVANNVITYDKYSYELDVTLPEGVDHDASVEWKVYIYDSQPGGLLKSGTGITSHDVTSSFAASFTKNQKTGETTVSASTANLKECGVTLNADSVVILTFNVMLNDDCKVGESGNEIVSNVVYSSNPNTSLTSETLETSNYLYTYQLNAYKKDRDTNATLKGAEFTIQAVASNGTTTGTTYEDKGSLGKYILKDGSFGTKEQAEADPYVTDANGKISVDGLDAGTYKLTEIKAPDGYRWHSATTCFTIAATYDENGAVSAITNTVFGNDDAAAGIDTVADDSKDGTQRNSVIGDAGTGAILTSGLVNVTIGNIQKIKLPLTGADGIIVLIIVGAIVAALSFAGIIIARKKMSKAETE